MVIAMELCRLNRGVGVMVGDVLVELLHHDAPEIETGDIPAPVKRASLPITDELYAMEEAFYDRYCIEFYSLKHIGHDIVKACDTLDLAFAALYERRRGNRHPRVKLVFRNCVAYLQEQMHVKGVKEFVDYLEQEWRFYDL
jgi:5'-deoxynucleotidase YfbR-like HD superfamily hydrolase